MEPAYRLLETKPGDGVAIARRNFRRLALERHPDKISGSIEAFIEISEALKRVEELEGEQQVCSGDDSTFDYVQRAIAILDGTPLHDVFVRCLRYMGLHVLRPSLAQMLRDDHGVVVVNGKKAYIPFWVQEATLDCGERVMVFPRLPENVTITPSNVICVQGPLLPGCLRSCNFDTLSGLGWRAAKKQGIRSLTDSQMIRERMDILWI